MAFGISCTLFAVFLANVLLGATTGQPFMGDIAEMLTLFAAVISFVPGILREERRRSASAKGATDTKS